MRRVARSVLSFGGIGFLPGPSGTWASLATAGIVVLVHGFGPRADGIAVLVAVAFGVAATLVLGGVVTSSDGHGDPRWVVTDEVAGQGVALLLAGLSPGRGIGTTLASFLLFRLFDITKPGPIRAAERLPGGLGILADDVLAGIAAGGLAFGLGAIWA